MILFVNKLMLNGRHLAAFVSFDSLLCEWWNRSEVSPTAAQPLGSLGSQVSIDKSFQSQPGMTLSI